jgi:hypothetical protein
MKRANGKLSDYYGKFEFRIVKYSNIGIIYKPISLATALPATRLATTLESLRGRGLEISFSWSLDTSGWKRAENQRTFRSRNTL